MNEYDFFKLNDKEFEVLSIDLLSKVEGKRIERFKPGKDSGVDGRYFITPDSEVIVQCKHWARSDLPALIRNLEKVEASKVKKLAPRRYIFVSSLELSRQNKKRIKNIFSPFIKAESDIFGNEDLNDLLATYKDVEQKHYKLWLCSTNVLRLIINAAILGRSASKIDEIKEFTPKYVITVSHEQALQKLDDLHSIIITGEPGIGKTKLADNLCLNYLIKEYELCYIEVSISEAEELYDREKKQVFYFDDFLGRNYLSALDRHEDSHVINFIKRISRDKSKRFILTSRSTVLNQGKRLSELFLIENIDRNEYELNIKTLSNLEKAEILYNHIWFGELDEVYVDELYLDKRYKNIIKHKNYNPRLISFITDSHKISDINAAEYWSYIEDTLENPAEIWGHVFDNQLDDHARILASLVSFNGRVISENKLRESFIHLANKYNYGLQKIGNAEFNTSVKLATGSVVNRMMDGSSKLVTYDLFNPALGDFLLGRHSQDEDKLYDLFESLNTKASLANLESILTNNIINNVVMKKVLNRLLVYCIDGPAENKSLSYVIHAIHLFMSNDLLEPPTADYLGSWFKSISFKEVELGNSEYLCDAIAWAINNEIIDADDLALQNLFDSILTDDLEHSNYVSINKLLDILNQGYRDKYEVKLKQLVVSYWQDTIDQDITNIGKLDEYLDSDDADDANNVLYDHVSDILSEYSFEFDEAQKESICSYCEVDAHIQNNIDNASYHDDQYNNHSLGSQSTINEDAAIENLFERT